MPAMISTIALPPLTPEVVVIVYYMMWKAAVHALPAYKQTRTGRTKDKLPGVKSILGSVWYFVRGSRIPRKVQNPLYDALEHHHRSVVRYDLCETIYLLVGSGIDRKFRGNVFEHVIPNTLLFTDIRELVTTMRPVLSLMHPELEHMVLNDDVHVIGGPISQLGPDLCSHYLMNKTAVLHGHMRTSARIRYLNRNKRGKTRVKLGWTMDHNYWPIVNRRMVERLKNMDWNSFRGLPLEDLCERAYALGEATFDGAFEEAQRLSTPIWN